MSIDILKEELKNSKIRNLYLFYGPEEYLKKYYLESIEKHILSKDVTGLNRIVIDGKPDTRKIIDATDTMPVFLEKKIVIVKNSGLMKSKKTSGSNEDTKSKGKQDDLLSYIQSVPNFTCLVFNEAEIDKRIKLVDAIKKNGLIVEFAFQKPAELVKWAIKVFKSNKKEIDLNNASQLVENSEQGMNEILGEINKLVSYMGERTTVTLKDIQNVCTKSIKSRIYDLTDAIADNNGSEAFKMLNDMIILKEPVQKILFMIARQFRQVLEMKLLNESGLNYNEAAVKMGISPFIAGKILKQASRFKVEKLKSALEESLELDLAIKTGRINDRIATELLIAKFQDNTKRK